MPDPESIPTRTLEALLAERDWVRRLARSLVSDVHRADDIAQSAWVSALERPPIHTRNLRSWLSTLVHNTSRTMRRGDARQLRRDADAEANRKREPEDPSCAFDRAELVGRLVQVVLALREPYRGALILCYFEGLTPSKIGERLGIPATSVRTHIKRGLELVRSELDRQRRGDREDWLAGLMVLAREPLSGAKPVVLAPVGALSSVFLILMKTKIALVAACLIGLGLFLWSQRRNEPRPIEAPSAPIAREEHLVAMSRAGELDPSSREVLASAPSSPSDAPGSTSEGSLRVEVVWAKDGSAAANVGVLVNRFDAFGRENDREGVTDEHGVFVEEHLELGVGNALVDRGGSARFEIESGKQSIARIAIPPGIRVRGRVTDPDAQPVEGASIELSYRTRGRAHVIARSNADGRFEIDSVEAERYREHYLVARHAGSAPSYAHQLEGRAGDTVDINLVLLGRGGSASGVVLSPAAKPVAHAEVMLGSAHPYGVELPGYARGTIAPAKQTWTDEEGRFQADDLALGANGIMVVASGFARQAASVTVSPEHPASIEIRLGHGASMRGMIQDAEGLPVANVKVEIDTWGNAPHAYTTTDASGAYRIENVPAGKHPVLADGDSHGRLRGTIEVRDDEELVWNATLDRGIVLEGRVVDEAGIPLEGWYVFASPTEPTKDRLPTPDHFTDDQMRAQMAWPRSWGHTKTDIDGHFLVCNQLDWESKLEVRPPHEPGSHPVVVLEDVKPGTRDVLIRVRPEDQPHAFVHGVVADENGRPVGDAELWLLRVPMQDGGSVSVEKSDRETGAFKIGPVPPGRYRLEVRSRGFVPPYVTEQDLQGTDEFDFGTIRLESAGAVCVTLKREGGEPIGELELWVRNESDHQSHLVLFGDRARSDGLTPGSYNLQVRGADQKQIGPWVPFEVVKGKQTDLEFVLPRRMK